MQTLTMCLLKVSPLSIVRLRSFISLDIMMSTQPMMRRGVSYLCFLVMTAGSGLRQIPRRNTSSFLRWLPSHCISPWPFCRIGSRPGPVWYLLDTFPSAVRPWWLAAKRSQRFLLYPRICRVAVRTANLGGDNRSLRGTIKNSTPVAHFLVQVSSDDVVIISDLSAWATAASTDKYTLASAACNCRRLRA